jgi:hypothetical protein
LALLVALVPLALAALTLTLPALALPLAFLLVAALLAALLIVVIVLLILVLLVLRQNETRLAQIPGLGPNAAGEGGNPHRRPYKEDCMSRAYQGHFLAFRSYGRNSLRSFIKSHVATFLRTDHRACLMAAA